jgi:hypothetical protein
MIIKLSHVFFPDRPGIRQSTFLLEQMEDVLSLALKSQFAQNHGNCDKLFAKIVEHGRWFSPGTPASSTTKTGRHDIAENGVKNKQIKSNQPSNTSIPLISYTEVMIRKIYGRQPDLTIMEYLCGR